VAAREAEEDEGIDEEADVQSEEETKGKGRVNVKQATPKEPAAPPKAKPKPRKKAKPSVPQPTPAPSEIEDSSPPVELGKRKRAENLDDAISIASDFTAAIPEPTSVSSPLATDVSLALPSKKLPKVFKLSAALLLSLWWTLRQVGFVAWLCAWKRKRKVMKSPCSQSSQASGRYQIRPELRCGHRVRRLFRLQLQQTWTLFSPHPRSPCNQSCQCVSGMLSILAHADTEHDLQHQKISMMS
jgi:hypothetical protein